LSKMSFGILTTFLRRLDAENGTRLLKESGALHLSVTMDDGPHIVEEEIPSVERPPMIEIEEYRKARAAMDVTPAKSVHDQAPTSAPGS